LGDGNLENNSFSHCDDRQGFFEEEKLKYESNKLGRPYAR